MKTPEDRFWEKVVKTDTCWNWIGANNGHGYGQFWLNGKNIPAHWFLLTQRPPKGFDACHKCDNPKCVRPDHIFIGTRSQNMADMVSKSRHNPRRGPMLDKSNLPPKFGSLNGFSKLSEDEAKLIKACPKIHGFPMALSKYFNISSSVVYDIINGKRWTHIPKPTEREKRQVIEMVKKIKTKSKP